MENNKGNPLETEKIRAQNEETSDLTGVKLVTTKVRKERATNQNGRSPVPTKKQKPVKDQTVDTSPVPASTYVQMTPKKFSNNFPISTKEPVKRQKWYTLKV